MHLGYYKWVSFYLSFFIFIHTDFHNLFCFTHFSGPEIKLFSRKPNCIFKSFLKVFCKETNTSLGSMQKFGGAAGVFKGALGSWHPLISSLASIFRTLI